jgi:peptidoglycan/xylan/chitin deacetylase (PgdA/CDA1 family)
MFHDVSAEPSVFSTEYNLNVSPDNFSKQLGFINKYFRVIDAKQLLELDSLEEPTALITFDDGLKGYFETALPILTQNNCPSLIFLNMEPVEGGVFWSGLVTYICDIDPDFRKWLEESFPQLVGVSFLTIGEELVWQFVNSRPVGREKYLEIVRDFHNGFANREMLEKAAGVPGVYFGSHLYNHFNAVQLSMENLKDSYVRNMNSLSRYKNVVPMFAYPFGQPGSCLNANTHSILRDLGAKRLFDSVQLFNSSPDNFLLHRVNMTNDIFDVATFKRNLILPSWRNAIKRTQLEHAYASG